MRVTRRSVIAGSALLMAGGYLRPARAALPPPEAALTAEVQSYLDSLRTIRARFEQLGPDGELASGDLYLSRPGKLRFDYDPPSKIMLIATDWRLIFQDASIKQINVIPVRQTPLGFLLADRIALSGDVEVTQVVRARGEIGLRLVRTDEPDQGSVVLYLAERPMALRRWSVTDAQGLTTQIILDSFQPNVRIDPAVFRWQDPQLFGWPQD